VAEPIYAPVYPGPSVRLTCDGGFVIPQPFTRPAPDPAPTVVDDTPAALIARLTAGDRREGV
jgi:hypothetical protein